MPYDEQYDNPKLWKLVSYKGYVSVPAEVPTRWSQRSIKSALIDVVIYVSGEYEIRGYAPSTARRRSYTVYRQGVELPLSFTGLLRIAKDRAVKNARGEDRMHLA